MIDIIVAARPNFIKLAPLVRELRRRRTSPFRIVHTGQHYDADMSDSFFGQLEIGEPDVNLGIAGGSSVEQISRVMAAYNELVGREKPQMTVVVGDVNAVTACSFVASSNGIALAHLEAGLRSFDRQMPEEINRLVADQLADFLWTPSPDAVENLLKEGRAPDSIIPVGNIMIDTYVDIRPRLEERQAWRDFGLDPTGYGVVTLHRPSNVDDPARLSQIVETLTRLSASLPIVFPVHPRTRLSLIRAGLMETLHCREIIVSDPLDYIAFQSLVLESRFVLTDSGGIQEETSFSGIPCFTLRRNTERPITVTSGTNRLVEVDTVEEAVAVELTDNAVRKPASIEMWDGHTAVRVVDSIEKILSL